MSYDSEFPTSESLGGGSLLQICVPSTRTFSVGGNVSHKTVVLILIRYRKPFFLPSSSYRGRRGLHTPYGPLRIPWCPRVPPPRRSQRVPVVVVESRTELGLNTFWSLSSQLPLFIRGRKSTGDGSECLRVRSRGDVSNGTRPELSAPRPVVPLNDTLLDQSRQKTLQRGDLSRVTS